MLDHLNNARCWEAVEDELAARCAGRRPCRAAVEFRGAVGRGEPVDLVSEVASTPSGDQQLATWLVSSGDVRMSAVVTTVARDKTRVS